MSTIRMDLVASLVLVGWAAVDAFGWLYGLGTLAAVYLAMPSATVNQGGRR